MMNQAIKTRTATTNSVQEALKQYRINGGVQFVFDVDVLRKGPVENENCSLVERGLDLNPFNAITQTKIDDYLANCSTHILLGSTR